MKYFKAIQISLLFVIAFAVSCRGQKTPYTPPEGSGFNVVELFTSEGCSSCPAADKAMVALEGEYKQNFYALEFHVDYWNYLGWKDKFSDKAYTDRQQQYHGLFRSSSVYTPQAIINGMVEEVGSDKAKMRPFLNQNVLKEPTTTLDVSATAHLSKVFVAYSHVRTKGQLLNIALVQKKAIVNVRAGENEGKQLTHTNIVRDFKTIDITEDHGFVEVYLPQGIVAEECSIIAYVQKKGSWEVIGVSACGITPENH